MKMVAEIEVMLLQAKECQKKKKKRILPANDQKLGERPGTDPPSWLSKGSNPVNWLILNFQPPEL